MLYQQPVLWRKKGLQITDTFADALSLSMILTNDQPVCVLHSERKLQQQNVLGSPRFNNLEGSAVRTRVSPNYWELEDGLVISSLALLIYRVYHRLGSIWKSGHLTLMSKMATRSYLTSLWL